jgi:hypothetical protein
MFCTLLVCLAVPVMTVPAVADTGISYVERSWNGSKVVEQTKSAQAVRITSQSGNKLYTDNWYYVSGGIVIDGAMVFQGDANIILCDGAALVTKGIFIPKGSKLNIYGQSTGTGALN